jgi:hypothetical protein
MNDEEKYKIAFRFTTGASTGLTFLEDYLCVNQKTDLAFIRSIYMLLSYNTELLLKSRIVMAGSFLNKDDLKKKLTILSHDLIKIKKELGDDELLKIGIEEITKNNTQYIIKTINKTEIIIEDFIDIRYDYIFGKMRSISNDEYKKIKEYIDGLFSILKSVKNKNEERTKKELK